MSDQPAYLSDAWGKTFPDTDVAAALSFMHSTWKQLVHEYPDAVHAVKCKEPEVTQTFGEHLQVKGQVSALSGIFDYEVPKSTIDPKTGKRTKRLRTDILYQDSAIRFSSGKRLSIIFEFKKLKNNSESRSAYVGKNGMERFISGYYKSHAEKIAFMVGMIHLDVAATIAELEVRLKKDGTHRRLYIQPAVDGSYIRKPSEWFKETVNFDTVHSRTAYGDAENLTLCHFFLEH